VRYVRRRFLLVRKIKLITINKLTGLVLGEEFQGQEVGPGNNQLRQQTSD
jgi:hypothetical protein